MAEPTTIPIICGPTGSGKTGTALSLARDWPLEIISADSRQMIKYLDLGTAKPTAEEQSLADFHFVDTIEPGERYTAYQFLIEADRTAGEILDRGRHPLVVGGTGLYLSALSDGVVEIEEDDGGAVRTRLQEEMAELGPEQMHLRLKEIDPAEAERIHPNNKVRVIRALEIFELTGKRKSDLAASDAYKKSRYRYAYVCLSPPRDVLYARIDARVDEMMRDGLLDEIEELIKRGLGDAIRIANVIGYEELLDFLEDRCPLDEAVAMIKQNSRRYAKRQMTWFRNRVRCLFCEDSNEVQKAVERLWTGRE